MTCKIAPWGVIKARFKQQWRGVSEAVPILAVIAAVFWVVISGVFIIDHWTNFDLDFTMNMPTLIISYSTWACVIGFGLYLYVKKLICE
jgi:hypothetical protein